ncbi:glycoside hydrolase family 3 N-terminal domain-containing protein [Gaiella sp.]|uniref:glycoside hydrolase family 3 N-terminal domain-containing protein n=1 Tax=Gaiella sp. TaxID=2663207 RepID=UPI0039837714
MNATMLLHRLKSVLRRLKSVLRHPKEHPRLRRVILASVLLSLPVVLGAAGEEQAAGRAQAAANRVAELAAGSAQDPTLRELVGQRFVVAMQGTSPSPALLARIQRGEVGGIILFGGNIESRAQLARSVAAMQQAARTSGRPPLLIATDQEGGKIRRVPWAGPALATSDLGRLSPAHIQREARAAGLRLRSAGINVDLAPVADVPAAGSFMALERRTFASDARRVAAAATAFARGLESARVAPALKHFPGIGRAIRNTDRTAVALPATLAELTRTDLLPFRKAIAAGAPIVMISNATYPALDAKPAPWSPRIQALLRSTLGFEGVTITDSLDGAAASRGRTIESVSSLAAQAGIDLLLLTGTEASSGGAYESVVRAAERGKIPVAGLQRSYARITALKEAVG